MRDAPLGLWVSFMAMRRISGIDQRIKNDASVGAAAAFLSNFGVGPMTDDGHHGEGKHE
ncbi:hypothetical protein ACE10Z_35880 [Bradyrhizobium sp. Pha-3]|uniref:hypothetical protein n=1 Tax=Bradyrhizobium sp. Pha-3 TaxID=208375 RepID=UPI0035D46199